MRSDSQSSATQSLVQPDPTYVVLMLTQYGNIFAVVLTSI